MRALAPDKIQGQGNLGLLVLNRDWGTWFANGNRSLMVSTAEADADRLQLSAAPNPATDAVRLSFTAPRSGPAQVLVSDMLGRAVLTQQWSAVEGTNQFDLNMAGLPAGTYAVRLLAGNTGATLKIVKQ